MATFPAIAPIYSAPKQSQVNPLRLNLGDGYEVSQNFGLNSLRPNWQLVWEVDPVQAAQIETFLQARADLGEPFDWRPPDAPAALKWRCDDWSVEFVASVKHRITATFRRVFEFSGGIPTLTPDLGLCLDDVLCESDIGASGSDFWVSRLASPIYLYSTPPSGKSQGDPNTNVVIDSRGNSYQAFLSVRSISPSFDASCYITKRTAGGQVIWTKEFTNDTFYNTTGIASGATIGIHIFEARELESVFVALQGTVNQTPASVKLYGFTYDGDLATSKQYQLDPSSSLTQGYILSAQYLKYSNKIVVTYRTAVSQRFIVIDPITWQAIKHYDMRIDGQVFDSSWITSYSSIYEFPDQTKIWVNNHSNDFRSSLLKLDSAFLPVGSVVKMHGIDFSITKESLLEYDSTSGGYWGIQNSGLLGNSMYKFKLDASLNLTEIRRYPVGVGNFTNAYKFNNLWYIMAAEAVIDNVYGSGVVQYNPDTELITNISHFSYGLPNNSGYSAKRHRWQSNPSSNRAVFGWGDVNVDGSLTAANVFCAGIRMFGPGELTSMATGPYTARARSSKSVSISGTPVSLPVSSSPGYTFTTRDVYSPTNFSTSFVDRTASVQWDFYAVNLTQPSP